MGTLRFEVVIRSALSPYVATTPAGHTIARLHRNTWPKQPWRLDMEGRPYRITHHVASNKLLLNEFRHVLMEGDSALADCLARPASLTTQVRIGDTHYHLVRQNRWLSIRYALTDVHGRPLGQIVETTGVALWRRRFNVEVPAQMGGAQAMFLFYLVASFSFR